MVKIIFWQSIKLKHPYLTENQVIYQNSTTLDPEEPKNFTNRAPNGVVLVEELPNGVIRTQLPRTAIFKRQEKKTFIVEEKRALVNVKTLWPENFTAREIMNSVDNVIKKEGLSIEPVIKHGELNGVKYEIHIENNKVNTAYPSWTQEIK